MSFCLTGGVRPSRKRRYSWYSLSVSSYLEISDLMAIIIALIFLISLTFSIFSLASASALHKNEQFVITFFKQKLSRVMAVNTCVLTISPYPPPLSHTHTQTHTHIHNHTHPTQTYAMGTSLRVMIYIKYSTKNKLDSAQSWWEGGQGGGGGGKWGGGGRS